jgi:hypothetical protein
METQIEKPIVYVIDWEKVRTLKEVKLILEGLNLTVTSPTPELMRICKLPDRK